MKKSDLKTGMIVELRDGDMGIVMRNTCYKDAFRNYIIFPKNGSYLRLYNISDDLRSESCIDSNDIMRVYVVESLGSVGKSCEKYTQKKLLWERKSEKTYNIDGIEYSETTLRNIIKKAHEKS